MLTDEKKKCHRCGEIKLREYFYKATRRRDGLQIECKSCTKERTRRGPEAERLHKLKWRYGLLAQEYYKLTERGCAICGAMESHNGRALDADHDHLTGKFRGLLCRRCNTALGLLDEDIARFGRCIQYLKRHQ